MGERGVDVIGTKFLMGDHLYSEGTGLLLAGVAVFVVGFFAFCCIDHCWLKRDLRKTDRWSIFPSDNSNSASDPMYSPWRVLNWWRQIRWTVANTTVANSRIREYKLLKKIKTGSQECGIMGKDQALTEHKGGKWWSIFHSSKSLTGYKCSPQTFAAAASRSKNTGR